MKLLRIFCVLLLASPAWAGQKYFVRKGGSDAAAGTSWATAWLTADKVQSTIVTGDTIIWGRGRWDEVNIEPPAGGSNTNWTVYACSTWYTGTTAAQKLAGKNLTIWCGGSPVGGWQDTTVNGVTAQKASYVPTNCNSGVSFPWAARQGDSMLIAAPALSQISSSRGHYFFSSNKVYVYPYNGSLGSSDTCWFSCSTPLRFPNSNTSHVRVWGIQIELGYGGAVSYVGGGTDSTFIEHCHIRMGGSTPGENGSAVLSRGDCVSDRHDNYLIADSIAWGVAATDNAGYFPVGTAPGDGMRHGAIVTIYSQSHMVIDSCYTYGFGAHGIYWKTSKSDIPTWEGNTVRNCVLDGTNTPAGAGNVTEPAGIFSIFNIGKDSAYGNIIKNYNWGILRWAEDVNNNCPPDIGHAGYGAWYANNTFYNCTKCVVYMKDSGPSTGQDGTTQVRYNVAYRTGTYSTATIGFGADGSGTRAQDSAFIDSNLWYQTSGSFVGKCVSGSYGIVDWRLANSNCSNKAFDVNTSLSNPNFTNPAAGDFSRPSASGEMDLTYGGQHWTKFGAVQEVTDCPSINRDSPTNGQVTTDITPTLQWDVTDPQSDNVTYSLLFDGNSTPTTVVASGTVATPANNLTYNSGTLSDRTYYYWRFIYSDTGCTETTSTYSLYIDTLKCPTVTLVSPTNGGTVGTTAPALTANFQTDGFANIIVKVYGQRATSPVTPTALIWTDTLTADSNNWSWQWTGRKDDSTYYWRIQAVDPDCAPYSATWSFTVDSAAAPPGTGGINLEGTVLEGTTIGKNDEKDSTESRAATQRLGARRVGDRAYPGRRTAVLPAHLAVYRDPR